MQPVELPVPPDVAVPLLALRSGFLTSVDEEVLLVDAAQAAVPSCSWNDPSAPPSWSGRRRRWRAAQLRPLHLPRSPRRPLDFYPRWEVAADTCVDILRTEAGAIPTIRTCTTSSASCPRAASDFRRSWGSHDVRLHGAGSKLFHHAVVGDLDLSFESVDIISDLGLTLTIYAAEPGSSNVPRLGSPGLLAGHRGCRGGRRIGSRRPSLKACRH